MNNTMRFLLLSFCAALLLPLSAAAQFDEEGHATDFDGELRWPEVPDPPEGAPNARLAVYFDLVRRTRSFHAEPNQPFEFFLVAHNPHMGVLSWELSLDVPEGIKILGQEIEGVQIGNPGEYIVSTRPEQCQFGDQVILAKFTGMVQEEGLGDLAIRIGPLERSSMREEPAPCYVICRPEKEIRPFDFDELPAVVNPVDLRIEDEEKPDFLKPVRG